MNDRKAADGGPKAIGTSVADATGLERLMMSHRVLVIVGAGGVGKTTAAAALSVAAAARGRRVLCLTIDPARRLAETLGIDRTSSAEQVVAPEPLARAGVPISGSLTAVMLDTKRTFDDLVIKHSSTPERARRLLENKLYKHVSTSLAGTHEYMAMEKLASLRDDRRFDLIVLDTPPTTNALDFLDAPQRLIEAIDSSSVRWFLQAFESTGRLSLSLLARSAALVLRGLGRITGRGFLEAMAELLTDLNDLFGGFKERAHAVEATLRSRDVTFLLVTSPAPMAIGEVLFFSGRLEQSSMPRGAFIVNRCRIAPPLADAPPTETQVRDSLVHRGLSLSEDAPARFIQAHRDAVRLARLDELHLSTLMQRAGDRVPVVRLPELEGDVRGLPALGRMAELLMRGGV